MRWCWTVACSPCGARLKRRQSKCGHSHCAADRDKPGLLSPPASMTGERFNAAELFDCFRCFQIILFCSAGDYWRSRTSSATTTNPSLYATSSLQVAHYLVSSNFSDSELLPNSLLTHNLVLFPSLVVLPGFLSVASVRQGSLLAARDSRLSRRPATRPRTIRRRFANKSPPPPTALRAHSQCFLLVFHVSFTVIACVHSNSPSPT